MAEENRPTVLENLARATKYSLVNKKCTLSTIDSYLESVVINAQNDFGIFITNLNDGKEAFVTWTSIHTIWIN